MLHWISFTLVLLQSNTWNNNRSLTYQKGMKWGDPDISWLFCKAILEIWCTEICPPRHFGKWTPQVDWLEFFNPLKSWSFLTHIFFINKDVFLFHNCKQCTFTMYSLPRVHSMSLVKSPAGQLIALCAQQKNLVYVHYKRSPRKFWRMFIF